MENFQESLLKSKLVSVWGIGYLGYTEIVKLQSKGFKVNVFDFTETDFERKLKRNEYPSREQIYNWSESSNIPFIDDSKINIAKKMDSMFTSNVHILAFPAISRTGNNHLKQIADAFSSFKNKLDNTLIIFLSATAPGMIDREFVAYLKEKGARSSIATAFRSDWTMEEFLSNHRQRIVAANDKESLEKARFFYDIMNIKYKMLSSIKEAEIYENARNSFQYTTEVFVNQLSLAYPDTNIRAMTEYLLGGIKLDASHLSIGAGGYKMPHAVQNILDGSKTPLTLSLINEVQNANLSMILSYAEFIKNMGHTSTTLLGLSIRGNQKNIELSPSVILAEYLNRLGIQVYIDDPFYGKEGLSNVLPFATSMDIIKNKLKSGALFVMTDHNKYRYLSQDDIRNSGIYNARIIIDNVSLFKEFTFSPTTTYHLIGDGRLGLF